MARRIGEDHLAHVHAAHVEAADIRPQRQDVADTVSRPAEGRAGAGLARIVGPGLEAPAGAGGEVDDDLDPAVADVLDHLAIMGQLHAGLPGLGVAHVDMDHGGAGLGGVDGRAGDGLRRHRDGRVLARRIRTSRHRAADHAPT
jgi:hypothetical protein